MALLILAGLTRAPGHVQDTQPRRKRVGDHRALSNRDLERPVQDVTAALFQPHAVNCQQNLESLCLRREKKLAI